MFQVWNTMVMVLLKEETMFELFVCRLLDTDREFIIRGMLGKDQEQFLKQLLYYLGAFVGGIPVRTSLNRTIVETPIK